jgi:hypothetical protein
MSKIQNEDIKSVTELQSQGLTASNLPNDDKIFITANSLNKTLKQAIVDGNLSGGGSINLISVTSTPYWITSAGYYLVNTSSAKTINLPSAASSSGMLVIIKDSIGTASANNITLVPAGTNKIDGVNANRYLGTNWGVWNFICNGTDWFMV